MSVKVRAEVRVKIRVVRVRDRFTPVSINAARERSDIHEDFITPFLRQDKTRQDKIRQDKTRQDKTRQDKTRQDKTRQDKTR